jgi:acyl-CoA thioesterase FadM
MNLYLRLVRVLLGTLSGPRLGIFDTSILRMRTWPADVDVWRANNGRYVTMMDLGRVDYFCRAGFLRPLVARGWHPIVGGLTIRYRRSLVVGRPFEIHTKVLWWDARFVYFEQRFEQDGETAAIAIVRGAAQARVGGSVPMEKVTRALALPTPPPCPEAVRLWLLADEAMAGAPRLAQAS